MSATDCRHSFALELIMMKTGILYTPDCEWSRVQFDCMLTAIGIWHTLAFIFIIVFIFVFYHLLCVRITF